MLLSIRRATGGWLCSNKMGRFLQFLMENGPCVVNPKGWEGRPGEVIQGSCEGDHSCGCPSCRGHVWGQQGNVWVYLESTEQMVLGVPATPCCPPPATRWLRCQHCEGLRLRIIVAPPATSGLPTPGKSFTRRSSQAVVSSFMSVLQRGGRNSPPPHGRDVAVGTAQVG